MQKFFSLCRCGIVLYIRNIIRRSKWRKKNTHTHNARTQHTRFLVFFIFARNESRIKNTMYSYGYRSCTWTYFVHAVQASNFVVCICVLNDLLLFYFFLMVLHSFFLQIEFFFRSFFLVLVEKAVSKQKAYGTQYFFFWCVFKCKVDTLAAEHVIVVVELGLGTPKVFSFQENEKPAPSTEKNTKIIAF